MAEKASCFPLITDRKIKTTVKRKGIWPTKGGVSTLHKTPRVTGLFILPQIGERLSAQHDTL